MVGIYPIPTTRTSELMSQSRLTSLISGNQLAIQRLQQQISTGIRLSTPSDDAPAALRAMALQRLLELKDQHQINLKTSQSFLNATDTSVNSVSDLLLRVRSTVQGSIGATAGDADRQAAVVEVQGAIQQLLSVANQKFRDRFLFAGSRDGTTPFVASGNTIRYDGNEGDLQSYTDTDLLTSTNVPGSHIFGAISAQVLGSADLSPVTTRDTRLADLRGGQGVATGRIAISDGTNTSIIDLTGAETLGDVADRIMASPPTGRTINARVTSQGLFIGINAAANTNLSVREVYSGTTAADLGIATTFSAGNGPIIGTDLDPRLVPTTRLSNILGVRASAYLNPSGANNGILLNARLPGSVNNGVAIQYVDDSKMQAAPGLTAGNETVTYSAVPVAARASVAFSGFNNNLLLTANTTGTDLNNVQVNVVSAGAIGNNAQVSYDGVSKTLTIGVDVTGMTQIQRVITKINAEGHFTAAFDASNPAEGTYSPGATILASDIGVVTGNTSNSGGDAKTVFVNIQPGGTTANHVVAALQGNAQVAAQFEVSLDDSDTSSPAFAGVGFVDPATTAISAGGSGTSLDQSSGLRIVSGGQTFLVDLSAAATMEDVLNAINTSGAGVLAQINEAGTGINVRARVSGTDFSIGENGGTTATQLGLRSISLSTPLSQLKHGQGVSQATGDDFTITRADGTSFAIDLGTAVTVGDVLNLINSHAANLNPANKVTARLAAVGNGIELVDSSVGAGQLQVQVFLGSNAAIDLGLIATGQTTSTGTGGVLTGTEINPQEVAGVFNSLLRLSAALQANNETDIERAMTMLDKDFDRINFSRAEIGLRGQNLDALKSRSDDETNQTKDSLSQEIDTDYTSAISSMSSRQMALEASLRLSAQTLQMSLLNFL
ncbi:MAG: flagellin hook IN motif-containing protein [Pirellulaceae bacterium]